MRIGVAQFIPGAARPLRHHVGVAAVGLQAITEVQVDVYPLSRLGQWGRRLAVRIVGVEQNRRVVRDIRQLDGQCSFVERMRTPVAVIDDREWFTPIPLPRKSQSRNLRFDSSPAAARELQPVDDGPLCCWHAHSIEVIRVDQDAIACIRGFRNIAAGNYFHDR